MTFQDNYFEKSMSGPSLNFPLLAGTPPTPISDTMTAAENIRIKGDDDDDDDCPH